LGGYLGYVRFTPESGHPGVSLGMSASPGIPHRRAIESGRRGAGFRDPSPATGGRMVVMPKRKQKIPMISLRGVTPFVLTPDQWKQLEALYRYDLDVQVRKEIVSATGEFLAFARAEKTGLMSHATGRVKRFSKMASQLLDVINDRRIEDVTRRY